MWPRQSHTLSTLTKLTYIKWKIKWTQVEQYDFCKIQWIVARNTLLNYPDFNENFKTYNNASVFQL